jgi:hypothetical protein
VLAGVQRLVEGDGQAEVQDGDLSRPPHEYVWRLEVPVENPFPVQRVHAVGQLQERGAQAAFVDEIREPRAALRLHPAAPGADVAEKIHAIDQLHREEPLVALGDELIQRDQVVVHQRRERTKLVLESEQGVWIGRRQHFQRDMRAGRMLNRLVHHPHAARTQLADDGVPSSAYRRRLGLVRRQTPPSGWMGRVRSPGASRLRHPRVAGSACAGRPARSGESGPR